MIMMKAVGLKEYLPIDAENSFLDLEIEKPHELKARDLLVEVKAVSVNPVDIGARSPKDSTIKDYRILGWDASGIVTEVGENCSLFKIGDEVFYAGALERSGTNAQYHVVDERIVGRKPKNMDFANAAALPLTSLTAWESLYDRMNIDKSKDAGKTILIINGAGGVGSVAIQLAKMSGLKVIATASRDESIEWIKSLGADEVINHHFSLSKQLAELGLAGTDYILNLYSTEKNWDEMCKIINPEGHMTSITRLNKPVNLGALMDKSVSFHWELMFTRAKYETPDMVRQHEILNGIAQLIETNQLTPTLKKEFSPINVENMKKAHALIESGNSIGKVVLSDFQ
ncbi:zinc-containing alcohol dehydrogenase [Enterococcus silesiacus]|uniref:Zinc-type alcohol dehydrogenase-like protein n=2 Tax=Enterococcus silesiacus TaxID=332949 RepID=A0AA91GJZ3_9ENTE|nr:zinc-containing alcohol dehydrogenase [Enterococcus silesiacus]